MAKKIQTVVQKIYVPNGSINGDKHYKDYGWQFIWIYNMDNTPPTVLASGVTASADLGIAAEEGHAIQEVLPPIIRDVPFAKGTEAYGMVDA